VGCQSVAAVFAADADEPKIGIDETVEFLEEDMQQEMALP
jgi:hypothetical protein